MMLTRRAMLGAMSVGAGTALMSAPAFAQLPQTLELRLHERMSGPAAAGQIAIPAEVRFVAQSIDGQGIAAGTPSLMLTQDQTGTTVLVGSTGCNQYRAPVTIGADGRISVGAVMSTKRGCPGERGDTEDAFVKALRGATRLTRTGNGLVLEGAGGRISFAQAN
jgi:heat shock protein HslJ